jgi:uncharacterized surface protein with fasciclin (FAS1) repeats
MNTLIDVAVADGHFKTLAAALTAAGLIDTLKGAGPFTVLPPLTMRSPSCLPVLSTVC